MKQSTDTHTLTNNKQKHKKTLLQLLLLLLPLLLWSQETKEIPYVSRLKAEIKESQILLTWKPDANAEAKLMIYSHTEKISKDNIDSALHIGTVDNSISTYLLAPETLNPNYYGVFYESQEGKPHKLFINFRNITNKSYKVTSLFTPEDLATEITEIRTEIMGDMVQLSFKSTKTDRELLLYRATAPFQTDDDLLTASSPITIEKNTTVYKDYPIPGIDYYYALLDAELVKIGKVEIKPGKNTTPRGVVIPLPKGAVSTKKYETKRSLPLPLLSLTFGIESGSALAGTATLNLPLEKPISPETEQKITNLLSRVTLDKPQKMTVTILGIDQVQNLLGEELALQKIINSRFTNEGDLNEGAVELKNFLRIKHSTTVEARGRFYLAQSYYFSELYKEAFMEFLLASESYYTEVQPWIESCFALMIDAANLN